MYAAADTQDFPVQFRLLCQYRTDMDFQRLLLQIGQSLSSEEVKALTFLCIDISQRSLHYVDHFSDLCSTLLDQALLSPDRTQLLHELLLTIQRPVLAQDIRLTEPGARGNLISPYRKLLYNLSEDITNDDLRNIKFLLSQKLPRRKLDENVTTLELFLEMEQMDLLRQTNLDQLQLIFASVCPMLNEQINQFKQQQGTNANSAFEEINPLPSVSQYDDNPRSLHGANHMADARPSPQPRAQVSVSLSNASMDFPPGLDNNYAGAVSEHVSDASTLTKNHPLKTPAEYTDVPRNPMVNVLTKAPNVEDLETYSMTGETRGFCLIVNNYNFSDVRKKKREGTQFDQVCLERVFQWLGFQVEVHHDCTGAQMLSVAKELSCRDHRSMDCVVCCFLSHGVESSIVGVDGHTISIRSLTEFFNGSHCPSLVNKPKLFFIQACQGTREQEAVSLQTDGLTPSFIESDAAKMEETIPADADFLMGMATVPSFVSYRNRFSGSWYVQSLCKNLVQLVPSGLDLLSILTKVNDDVSQKTDYYHNMPKKQMPQPAFSLRKKVIFPVPSGPPPELL